MSDSAELAVRKCAQFKPGSGGQRCPRAARADSLYCWQHSGKAGYAMRQDAEQFRKYNGDPDARWADWSENRNA